MLCTAHWGTSKGVGLTLAALVYQTPSTALQVVTRFIHDAGVVG